MVHQEKLSALVVEFACTIATDFPVQRILDHLVVRIVEALPDGVGRAHAQIAQLTAGR